EKELRKALELCTAAYGDSDPRTATTLSNLASFLMFNTGKLAEAEGLLERALGLVEQASGKEHPETARILLRTGILHCYSRPPDYSKAKEYFERALAIYEKTLGKESSGYAVAMNNLANSALADKEYDKAEEMFKTAQQIYLKMYGSYHRDIAMATYN